jgi:signal transduction histidine kinase
MIAEGSSSSQTPVPRGEPAAPGERDLPADAGVLDGSGIRAERVSPGLAERRALRVAGSGETETETALVRRAEAAEATVKTLETHVSSLQRRLEGAEEEGRRTSELAQRLESVEDALGAIRESHRRMALTVSELKDVAVRLRAAFDRTPAQAPARAPVQVPARPRNEDMADALAAAVERLRARAEAAVVAPPADGIPPVVRTPHKHSLSLIGRWRLRRKQRRGR